MSENLSNKRPELLQQPESPETHIHHERLEKLNEGAEKAANDHEKRLPEIKERIEQNALSAEQFNRPEITEHKQPSPGYVNRELKHQAYNRTMTRVRKKLPAPDRLLSKAIHQPVVEQISQVASSTVARPSGLLSGGFFALVGSSVFLWAAKQYGFAYNYLLFFLFFVGGFALGLILEFLFKLIGRLSKR